VSLGHQGLEAWMTACVGLFGQKSKITFGH